MASGELGNVVVSHAARLEELLSESVDLTLGALEQERIVHDLPSTWTVYRDLRVFVVYYEVLSESFPQSPDDDDIYLGNVAS